MSLTDALLLVWDDVADRVYRHPTVDEVVVYVRDEVDDADLDRLLADQRAGLFDDPDDGAYGDVHGAYVAVRAASRADVDRVVEAERWRGE